MPHELVDVCGIAAVAGGADSMRSGQAQATNGELTLRYSLQVVPLPRPSAIAHRELVTMLHDDHIGTRATHWSKV